MKPKLLILFVLALFSCIHGRIKLIHEDETTEFIETAEINSVQNSSKTDDDTLILRVINSLPESRSSLLDTKIDKKVSNIIFYLKY